MPVTGEIAELPLPELLNMMRFRAGKLSLLNTQQVSEMVLHFTPGYLCGFQADRRILKSENQVVDKLVAVTATPNGRFSFEPRHASSLMGSVRINIDRLALIIVSKVDELSVNRDQLPPPHRIFRLVPPENQPQPPPQFEDADLAEFFTNAENLLRCGISAEKLATIEQISVDQTLLYIYKLNILGLITAGRRDDLWAQLDRVLEPKSSPLRLSGGTHGEGTGGTNASPLSALPPPPIRSPRLTVPPPMITPKIGLGSLEQRKITRLLGPDYEEGSENGEDDLPPAA